MLESSGRACIGEASVEIAQMRSIGISMHMLGFLRLSALRVSVTTAVGIFFVMQSHALLIIYRIRTFFFIVNTWLSTKIKAQSHSNTKKSGNIRPYDYKEP